MNTIDHSIQNVSELAENLNDVSGSTGLIITDLEKKLRATEIELEVWLPKFIHEEAEMTYDYDDLARTEDDGTDRLDVHLRRRYEIGWATFDSTWQIAYRTRETRSGRDIRSDQGWAKTQERFCGPLRDAPRLIRIHAMSHIESLVGELTTEAERHIRTIERLSTQ